jgi:hypothetical protein
MRTAAGRVEYGQRPESGPQRPKREAVGRWPLAPLAVAVGWPLGRAAPAPALSVACVI